MHKSSEYGGTKVLAVVFECNHCPVSQLYEGRIEKLYEDYRRKGVTLVAINPNNAKAVRLNELGYTDVTDSLPEMKIRAAFRGIDWPYLYDGETQALSMKFGAVATPHIFIFDQERKLRYQGRIDDNQREELVKTHDARDALDAMLEGRPVAVAETRAFGCTTKWMSKSQDVTQEWAKIKAEPVTVEMVGVEELKALRANATDKVTLVNFWSTGCSTCKEQFLDFETTYRMYRLRAFNLVTVSTDPPSQGPAVLEFLKAQYASSPNKQFATADGAACRRPGARSGTFVSRSRWCSRRVARSCTRRKARSTSSRSGATSSPPCRTRGATSGRRRTGWPRSRPRRRDASNDAS